MIQQLDDALSDKQVLLDLIAEITELGQLDDEWSANDLRHAIASWRGDDLHGASPVAALLSPFLPLDAPLRSLARIVQPDDLVRLIIAKAHELDLVEERYNRVAPNRIRVTYAVRAIPGSGSAERGEGSLVEGTNRRRAERNDLQRFIDEAQALLTRAHGEFHSTIQWPAWLAAVEQWRRDVEAWLIGHADAPELAAFREPAPGPRVMSDREDAPYQHATEQLSWNRATLQRVLAEHFRPM